MATKRPTIRDVANRAGVSTATVSHVINKSRFVTDETKDKVLKAIKELDYYPSTAAKSLMSNESKIIGIVFSDISNPFFTEVYLGIESVLSENDFEVSLANTGESNLKQEKVLKAMLSRGIDGLIIAPTGHDSDILNYIIELQIPVVFIDRFGPHPETDIIQVNNEDAAYRATTHLINDGHEKIAIVIGLKHVTTTQQRLNGYIKALNNYGLPIIGKYLIWGQSRVEDSCVGVKKLLEDKKRPSAIFTTNNLMTLGALHAIRELNLVCPNDIGLIGFDEHSWGAIFSPPLSVMKQPTYQMGTKAAELLLAKIQNKDQNLLNSSPLEVELLVRGSCSVHCFENYQNSIMKKKRTGKECV